MMQTVDWGKRWCYACLALSSVPLITNVDLFFPARGLEGEAQWNRSVGVRMLADHGKQGMLLHG
jgi:hypothetical protein